jgi:hypothetical protein
VGDDEILAARFSDETWIAAVAADVVAHSLPHRVEDGGTAGEVHSRQLWRVEQDVRDLDGVPGNEVDDAGRQARRLEQLQHVVSAQHRARGRFPDDRVAHQRRRSRKIPGDRTEIEGGDRVDEAFQRSVLERVPHCVAADRLLFVQLLRVIGIEPPEINQLGCGVDFRLKHGF